MISQQCPDKIIISLTPRGGISVSANRKINKREIHWYMSTDIKPELMHSLLMEMATYVEKMLTTVDIEETDYYIKNKEEFNIYYDIISEIIHDYIYKNNLMLELDAADVLPHPKTRAFDFS